MYITNQLPGPKPALMREDRPCWMKIGADTACRRGRHQQFPAVRRHCRPLITNVASKPVP